MLYVVYFSKFPGIPTNSNIIVEKKTKINVGILNVVILDDGPQYTSAELKKIHWV